MDTGRLGAAFVLFFFLAVGGGCGDGSSKPAAQQQPRTLALVVDGVQGGQLTTSQSPWSATGRVLVFDSLGMPTRLDWTVQGTGGPRSGNVPVAGDGTWTLQVTLDVGDNEVTLDVAGTTAVVHVTYNGSYAFGGRLVARPDVLYVGEPRTFIVNIALTDPATDPDDVRLVRVDNGVETQVGTLTDDGDLGNGDEIEADHVYSALLFDYLANAPGFVRLRVVVGLIGGGSARSEVLPLLATDHLTDAELQVLLAKQDQIGDQLEQAQAQGTLDEALAQALADLQADPDVAQAGLGDNGGLWVIYAEGIGGVWYLPEDGTKGGGTGEGSPGIPARPPETAPVYDAFLPRERPGPVLAGSRNLVESNKVLAIAAEYYKWGENDDIPEMQMMLKQNGCFDVTYVTFPGKGLGTVEAYKHLGGYGIVLLSGHGNSFYKGVQTDYQDTFLWNGSGGQVVFSSNMAVTEDTRGTYEDDLKAGRLVLYNNKAIYGMLPTFFMRYAGSMPNSLVYVSPCRGAWNGTMAQAFLSLGAGAYLGYDEVVHTGFCQETGPPFLDMMLEPGTKLGEAYLPAVGYPTTKGKHPAVFQMFGADTLEIDPMGLKDAGFESGNVLQAWSVAGDARIIPGLGEAASTEGSFVGLVSTGLGFTDATGSMSQTFCLPMVAEQIAFDWNYFSEEFQEYCGDIYQDAFAVSLTEADSPANTVMLLLRTVDDLCGSVHPVPTSFDQGDVWATGWRTATTTIPASLRGKKVVLQFYTTDVGDSIYDTAVLLDRIQLLDKDGNVLPSH